MEGFVLNLYVQLPSELQILNNKKKTKLKLCNDQLIGKLFKMMHMDPQKFQITEKCPSLTMS